MKDGHLWDKRSLYVKAIELDRGSHWSATGEWQLTCVAGSQLRLRLQQLGCSYGTSGETKSHIKKASGFR